MVDPDKIVAGIAKSGFVLEHKVSDLLRAHKWSVINDKYYLDDVQESAREIDLVAYKISRRSDFLVYTALILSCNRGETASRIHFINAAKLDTVLDPYDALHDRNVRHFDRLFTEFNTNVFANYDSYVLLRDTFTARVSWVLEHEYRSHFGRVPGDEKIHFSMDDKHILNHCCPKQRETRQRAAKE